jgi:N-acyl-D-amino-acid deacylase
MEFELVINNGTLVDGTGNPRFRADIGIAEGKIVAVSPSEHLDAKHTLDATGLMVSPGFVDIHSHADLSLLQYPLARNFIMQGVTTFLGGNCGMSMAPLGDHYRYRGMTLPGNLRGDVEKIDWHTFGEWLSRVESNGMSLNYIPIVGHSAVRVAVMGEDFRRKATPVEIEAMKTLVEEAMRSGAFGISSSFDPGPGEYATYEEIVALAKIAKTYGGLYTPHTRYHQESWISDDPKAYGYGIMHGYKGELITGRYHGLMEALEIASGAEIRLLIAHLTPSYILPEPQPEFLQEAAARATLMEIIDHPRERGIDVFFNVIAYTPSIAMPAKILDSFFHAGLSRPEWMSGLNRDSFVAELKSEAFREIAREWVLSGRFKFFMVHPVLNPYWMDSFMVVRCRNKEYEGKTIGEIARKKSPGHIVETVYRTSIETLFDIISHDPETTWISHYDARENSGALRHFVRHPNGMPCTDSFCMPLDSDEVSVETHPPIAYGLFPHYLKEFVKERKSLTLEEAIMKATSLPAQTVLGLADRGVLRPGAYADIVVFDFEKIGMGGDFRTPARPPTGIDYVLVNGQVTYAAMNHTGVKAGKVIRRRS